MKAAEEGSGAGGEDYDAVIVGASLAGCATAIMLGRAGARVALVEQRPDPSAYKRVCSHFIQGSAVATLERMGLVEPMLAAGAVRSRFRIHGPAGWIMPPPHSQVPAGINLRRELLDPLIRGVAAETRGVELMLGYGVGDLLHDGRRVCGALARNPAGRELRLRSRLLVGADGRGSRVAAMAKVRRREVRHGRVAYGAYFRDALPDGAPDASLWMIDPDMAAAFPTDDGLTFYAAMPTKRHAESFRADPGAALMAQFAGLPDAPALEPALRVGRTQGKLDLLNVAHAPVAPGLALVGDAALAIDPLWGVGCGWALQSAEWLADSVSGALAGSESLARGLARYRRRRARGLWGHAAMIYDYAGGRRLTPVERMIFSAAAEDEVLAGTFEAYGSRSMGAGRMLLTTVPRAGLDSARTGLSRRRAERYGGKLLRPGTGGAGR